MVISATSKRARHSAKIRAKWAQHIAAQQASGLTQAAYCHAHGLDTKYFCVWKRKLKQHAPVLTVAAEPEVPAALIPVSVKPAVAKAIPIKRPASEHQVMVRLPSGIALEWRIPAAQGIADLIVELARLPC